MTYVNVKPCLAEALPLFAVMMPAAQKWIARQKPDRVEIHPRGLDRDGSCTWMMGVWYDADAPESQPANIWLGMLVRQAGAEVEFHS